MVEFKMARRQGAAREHVLCVEAQAVMLQQDPGVFPLTPPSGQPMESNQNSFAA